MSLQASVSQSWWRRPSWTTSADCAHLCRVLAALRQQHPDKSGLFSKFARNIAQHLRPSKKLVAHTIGEDQRYVLYLLDARTGLKLRRLDFGCFGQHSRVHDLVSMAGECAVVGLRNTLHIMNLELGVELQRLQFKKLGNISCVFFSPDATRVVIAHAGDTGGTIQLFDAENGVVLQTRQVKTPVGSLAYSPDGAYLTATLHRTIRVWDAETNAELWERNDIFQFPNMGRCVYSPSGGHLAAVCGGLRLLEAKTGADQWTFEHSGAMIFSVAFSPIDGHLAAAGLGKVFIVDVGTGIQLQCLPLDSPDLAPAVAYSPRGTRLACGGGNGTLRFFDVETGEVRRVGNVHRDIVDLTYVPADKQDHRYSRESRISAEEPAAPSSSVIQIVDHGPAPAAVIVPAEAARTQQEIWASSVEALISKTALALRKCGLPTAEKGPALLLTFARHTRDLDRALLASLPARAVAQPQPSWAGGAKIFVEASPEALRVDLPPGLVLKPWHVVLLEVDEDQLLAAIRHLHEPLRRLKHQVGRRVLGGPDDRSTDGNADEDSGLRDVDILAERTFVRFARTADSRSSRTV